MTELRVGMIGYAFMGKAHSQAWRNAPRFFDLPLRPSLAERRRHAGRWLAGPTPPGRGAERLPDIRHPPTR
jgi:predicted dehydrogenase